VADEQLAVILKNKRDGLASFRTNENVGSCGTTGQ
jgi:hypothetical protein